MVENDSLEKKIKDMGLGDLIHSLHLLYDLDRNVILAETDLETMDRESQENWSHYQTLVKELNRREQSYLERPTPPIDLMRF